MNCHRIIVIVSALVVGGCGGKLTCGKGTHEADGACVANAIDEEVGDTGTIPTTGDQDGDGYDVPADCDDENADVYPGAEETCDGIDNDCDGRTDEEDATGQGTFHADADNDGYGDAGTSAEACSAPDGMVEDATDCDDTNAAVHPDAEEIWYDGIDQDCAGDSDDDMDGDGFPGGADGTDCDDEEPLAFPGAVEVCGDGVDNDCDGDLGPCGLRGILSVADANAKLYAGTADIQAGQSVAMVGDVDGDSIPDVLVGTPRSSDGDTTNNGGAIIIRGSAEGWLVLEDEGNRIHGEAFGDLAGSWVAAAGDVDGDGVSDVLIGAPYATGAVIAAEEAEVEELDTGLTDTGGAPTVTTWSSEPDAGAIYLVTGGISTAHALGATSTVFRGFYDSDDVGAASVILDDQDGDGQAEWAVGIPGDGARGEDAGGVALVDGPWAGEVTAEEGHFLSAAGPGDRAGSALAAAGDVNGDGLADLVVAAPMAESAGPGTGLGDEEGVRLDAGAVYVMTGPIIRDWALSDASAIHVGANDHDHAGTTLASTGDLDGDGMDDLLIGAPGLDGTLSDVGAAYIVIRPAAGGGDLATSRARLEGTEGAGRAGISIAGAGDTDGDGQREVLVGADRAQGGAGVVYLVAGDVAGTFSLNDATARFVGETAGDWAGTSIAGGSDLNADGIDDILIGAPGEDSAGEGGGTAYIFWGEAR